MSFVRLLVSGLNAASAAGTMFCSITVASSRSFLSRRVVIFILVAIVRCETGDSRMHARSGKSSRGCMSKSSQKELSSAQPQACQPLPITDMPSVPDHSIRICADRGGTFCDVHASYPDPEDRSQRKELVVKLCAHQSRCLDRHSALTC